MGQLADVFEEWYQENFGIPTDTKGISHGSNNMYKAFVAGVQQAAEFRAEEMTGGKVKAAPSFLSILVPHLAGLVRAGVINKDEARKVILKELPVPEDTGVIKC